jgi:hypothetical protein
MIDKLTTVTEEYLQQIQDMKEIKSLLKFEASTDDMNMNLWKISSLIHKVNSSYFTQPDINNRPQSVSLLNNRDFLSKMQGKNNDFGEEMHALVYKVVKDNKETPILLREKVKVYSMYTIEEQGTMGHEISDTYAIYPTTEGLQRIANALHIKEKDDEGKLVRYVVPNNSATEKHRLMESYAMDNRDICYSWKYNKDREKIKRKNNTAQIQHA